MADAPVVPARVRTLATQVGDPTPMRRGSLSERYVKCSKPGCRCADEAEARHGPYYSLTRTVAGRTQSRFLSAAQAPVVREQIVAWQLPAACRGLLGGLRALGRRRARGPRGAGPRREDQKKGSARRSPRKSSRRSTRS